MSQLKFKQIAQNRISVSTVNNTLISEWMANISFVIGINGGLICGREKISDVEVDVTLRSDATPVLINIKDALGSDFVSLLGDA